MQYALLGLTAETSLHAGTGRSTGVVDLPIMREAHTGWPCVYGSAVKGALRSQAHRINAHIIQDVFGPDTQNASDHAGALAVGDARLLLLPVRSLSSHFKWVTCPALLRRTAADAQRMGITDAAQYSGEAIKDDQAVVAHDHPASLFLEEFCFTEKKQDLTKLVGWLSRFAAPDAEFAAQLHEQLVIVSDDMFAHLSSFATPVTPHIALENERKAVKPGALWYEETLPPESVLYITLAANPSRRKDTQISATEIIHSALQLFPVERPYLQLGGNETVGMGWCKVKTVFCSTGE